MENSEFHGKRLSYIRSGSQRIFPGSLITPESLAQRRTIVLNDPVQDTIFHV